MPHQLTPTPSENAQRNWRDRYYRSPLISHRWISRAIGLGVATVVAIWFQDSFYGSYSELRSSIPAAMISVAGFVIAALTILISSPGGSTAGSRIAENNPAVWSLLLKQASSAAKVAGGVALLVVVEPFIRTMLDNVLPVAIIDTCWVVVFVGFVTLALVAALRVVWLLERVSAPLPQPK